jgi:ATP-dependent RNA helicase DeaD
MQTTTENPSPEQSQDNLPQARAETETSSAWQDFEKLPAVLREVLAAQGILQPTVIQSYAIPAALSGRDVLAQSSTGSGKTLAFSLPVALKLKKHGQLRALILTPTRELATQVAGVLDSTVSALKLRTLAITGGSSYARQKRALHEGVDIVVGTPGRINDLLTQGSLQLSDIESFVLDEVDQMLDFGFKEELEAIRSQLPATAQTLFFSATLSSDIRSVARKLLKNPVEVNIQKSAAQSPSTIRHGYLEVRGHSEQKALINALLYHNPSQAIIFCKTRQECAELCEALLQRGFDAAALHGDLTQVERNQTMDKFREKKLKFLIATNVAARGIDVQELPLVVNFNVPFDVESYTHRVGRTGRNGAEGQAWTIVTPTSCRAYESMMRQMKLKPELIAVPSCSEVIHRSADGLLNELKATREKGVSKTIEKAVERQLASLETEDKDKILKEMITRYLEKLNVYYHDDMICHKPLVRLDGAEIEKPSFRDKRKSAGFSDDRRPRPQKGSWGQFKGKGKPKQAWNPSPKGPSKPAWNPNLKPKASPAPKQKHSN